MRRSVTNADGMACRAEGLEALLSTPPAERFEPQRRNPCTRAAPGAPSVCVPYFYLLGAFHAGVRDLYGRLLAHPDVFVPAVRTAAEGRAPSYPYFFSETHLWERMLWRGCDYGLCPRGRGAGAEPLPLSSVAELGGEVGRGRVFGEAAGGALTFTWSSTHSLLHRAWEQNMSKCRRPKRECFPAASEGQRRWEESVGGGDERRFTVPWLMRAVHGTERVRLIALLREPVQRFVSAYHFWPQYRRRYGKDAAGVRKYAHEVVPAFRACLAALSTGDRPAPAADRAAPESGARVDRWALEECAFNFESLSPENEGVYYHADQLLKGLYSAYVPTWLRAFGSRSLLFLRAEDYWAAPAETLQRAVAFLGLPPLDERALERAAAQPIEYLHGSNATFYGDKSIVNSHAPLAPAASRRTAVPGRTRIPSSQPIDAEAKQLLRGFYATYNDELARVLGDERFRWADVE